MGEDRKEPGGEVLRLRHRYMIEHIRRAEDPAWTEALERQQTAARLGRMFREQEMDLSAILDYALDLKQRYRR